MQRLVAAPAEALFGVVGRPHVEGGERVDAARVGDREVAGDFGPGADAHAVGLLDGPPEVNACSGGSPSLQTPSSSARRSSG